ncbi:zinc finger CCHC domain-containing protein 8 [Echinops telfairi]|uniref:Zinc finger CCHC domain-containing protein 8 n=1 Tax=Echinops telfairi TaxID=9371 RepID=A0AC55DLM8_ECHTE|nr:zinc finger CCHC domain-containing protein 8 [Echinops telfairi]
MNNAISKQYHQEIEEFVSNLVKRFEEQQKKDVEKTSFNLLPQPSSVVLEEDHKVEEEACVIKNSKEPFSVVGSVLYFSNFCLDKLGQPLLNENPQLTEGWEIPKYQQVFSQIVSLEGQEIQVKAKRPKPHCFNCGSEEHQMKECPMPRNAARISEKRKEYMDACGEANNQSFQQRYHAEEVEERFGRFKPGVISEELQDALGVTDKSLPPFIYRMRQLGYPPGWLKEAELENSGLALYDGKDEPDGEAEAGELQQNKSVTYDLSKLVNYPGFNISTPRGIPDEWRMFGSIPMQASQQKDVFANYLTSNFQVPSVRSSSKRSSSQSSPCSPKKQKKNSSSEASPASMELDSGSLFSTLVFFNHFAPVNCEDATLDSGNVVSNCGSSNGGGQNLPPGPSPSTAAKMHSPIPDMSKFAMGITPFEFENMAESTGMYLRIRNLLKNSPRNQQKNKKTSE